MAIKTPQENAFVLWKKFMKEQKMSDFFLWFSHEVWESQKFARFSKTHEEELTNLMVRSLMQAIYYGKKQAFPIRIFHARNENTNGRDLEIIYKLKSGGNIKFYCQAKLLYTDKTAKLADAKYEKLGYKNYKQLESLVEHSKDGGYPLYLFYNYDDVQTDYEYGCTLVSAYYLHHLHFQEKVNLNHLGFHDLAEVAKPLKTLDEVESISNVNKWEGGMNFKIPIKTFKDEIFDNPKDPKEKKWQEFLKPKATIQGVSHALEGFFKTTENDDSVFNPRYRIVITQKPIDYIDREPYHL